MYNILKMKKEHLIILGVVLIFAVAVILIFSSGKKNDLDFCRYVFKGLIQGDQAMQKYIDWENFKGLDIDVGKTYLEYPELERAKYRKTFINSFAFGFKEVGGRYAGFSSWRIHKQTASGVVVAADYLGKTLLFAISLPADGKRKISAIQWEGLGG
ncbi:MAG: hypothetical protein KJ923_02005 [Candidatus Omnitrophica bacterium]|nr:hypothetical protein [Candidatus Omnitrophota bacterium]